MVQQVNLPLVTPASHTTVLVHILTAPLLTQIPANVLCKAAEGCSSNGALATYVRQNSDGVLASGFRMAQPGLTVVAI